jgi:hypothetical protein
MRHINPYPVFPNGYRKKESASFGPFTWPLRENYDSRYVINPADLANDPDYGVPDFLWKAGDGNGCTVGPPGFTFTLTGAPTLDGVTPFQTPDGVPLIGEKHTGASHRSTNAYNIDPADRTNDDQVIAVSFIEPYVVARPSAAAYRVVFSTDTALNTSGWSILYNWASGMWCLWGSHFMLGPLSLMFGMHSGALTVVALVPGVGGGGAASDEGFCGAQRWTQTSIGAPGAGGGVSLGSCVDGSSPLGDGGQIIWAATWSGLGIAANWKADSNKLLKRLAMESAGMRETAASPRKLWAYQIDTMATVYWSAYYDRDGNLWPVEGAVPGAGDSTGLHLFADRRNYTPNSFDPQSVAGWTVTGAAVLTAPSDTAALTTAKLWRTGTLAFKVVNATGVDQYVWASSPGGAAGDMPVGPACLSVYARYDAGAGARLGWWTQSTSSFTDVGAVSGNYARTILNNTTPPAADCRFCLKIPDGCTLYFTLTQAEEGLVSSLPILNYGTNTLRRTFSIPITEYTPATATGGIVAEAAPLGYSGAAMGADNVMLDTVAGAAIGIMHMESAAPGWATGDGTTQISVGSPTNGVYDFLWTAWGTISLVASQYLQAGAALVVGAFDGAKGVNGLMRARALVADIALRYIQVRYP